MARYLVSESVGIVCLIVCLMPLTLSKPRYCCEPEIIDRCTWGAREPLETTTLVTPTPYVVVHHSSVPGACFNFEECSRAMRSMQTHHQVNNGWSDIGYNFAVGSDGLVYEGRGWHAVGAHTISWNTRSIGIVLIGHWVSELPPAIQLRATEQLISLGVNLGVIGEDYHLVGHRQLIGTECPGDALYEEISNWKHFADSIQTKSMLSNDFNAL